MGAELRLTVEDEPDPAAVTLLSEGLRDFNRQAAGPSGFQKLAILLRDWEGEVVGGALGGSYWGWLHLDLLWIREEHRGYGYGTALLQAAETEAKTRGCRGMYLDTFSFQAPEFYKRHGFTVLGQLDDIPPGHTHYFLAKRF